MKANLGPAALEAIAAMRRDVSSEAEEEIVDVCTDIMLTLELHGPTRAWHIINILHAMAKEARAYNTQTHN